MVPFPEDNEVNAPKPKEFRCAVFGDNQFQLPAELVDEVGFKSPAWETAQSAMVAWYYDEEGEKAVLANNSIERPSLELVGASALYGVSNDELDSRDVSSARVTIITELPDSVYERLTNDDLVLRPLYEADNPQLNNTGVSVYPAGEFDQGKLQNVTHDRWTADEEASSNGTSDRVGTYDGHINTI